MKAVVTIGCPSCGKSTFARGLKGYETIERDLIREEISGSRKEFYEEFSNNRHIGESAVFCYYSAETSWTC